MASSPIPVSAARTGTRESGDLVVVGKDGGAMVVGPEVMTVVSGTVVVVTESRVQ